jgi:phage repressor protein C with HTH and peptisase S24 domain
MEPEIFEGDTVIAEKQENKDIDKNGMYVVTNQDEVLIKKVLPLKEGVLLMSTNSKHQPIATNQGKLNVVGRVVGVYKSY